VALTSDIIVVTKDVKYDFMLFLLFKNAFLTFLLFDRF